MSSTVDQMVQAAGQAANAGRWHEAERLWREVWKLEPQHPKALFSLGAHALKRGEVAIACDLLRAARTAAPGDLLVLMALATACRQHGDAQAELEAIQAALAVDAYFVPALLAKAGWLERFGSAASAAATYANVLKIAPSLLAADFARDNCLAMPASRLTHCSQRVQPHPCRFRNRGVAPAASSSARRFRNALPRSLQLFWPLWGAQHAQSVTKA